MNGVQVYVFIWIWKINEPLFRFNFNSNINFDDKPMTWLDYKLSEVTRRLRVLAQFINDHNFLIKFCSSMLVSRINDTSWGNGRHSIWKHIEYWRTDSVYKSCSSNDVITTVFIHRTHGLELKSQKIVKLNTGIPHSWNQNDLYDLSSNGLSRHLTWNNISGAISC